VRARSRVIVAHGRGPREDLPMTVSSLAGSLLILGLLAQTPEQPDRWSTIRSAEGDFSAMLPSQASSSRQQVSTPAGKVEQEIHFCRLNGSLFTAQRIRLSSAVPPVAIGRAWHTLGGTHRRPGITSAKSHPLERPRRPLYGCWRRRAISLLCSNRFRRTASRPSGPSSGAAASLTQSMIQRYPDMFSNAK
jgi:hypothetical protein